jgi:SAM-dependent methyltransferase
MMADKRANSTSGHGAIVVNKCWAVAESQGPAAARTLLWRTVARDPLLLRDRSVLGALRRLHGLGPRAAEERTNGLPEDRRLPLPPLEMRSIVSPITDESYYDNPTGEGIWGPLDFPPLVPNEAYRKVFDFGCGCGREARRLLLQKRPPQEYVGLDIHAGMIDWCQRNLQTANFRFYHLDVWSAGYGADNTRTNRVQPISQLGSDFSIVEANSVFTHNLADQAEFYLDQMRSMLAPRGIIRGTWFFFNKQVFPPMGEKLNTLFIDEGDLTHAVYYDWDFFRTMVTRLGYRVVKIDWSHDVGFHNMVYLGLDREFADLSDVTPPSTSAIGF